MAIDFTFEPDVEEARVRMRAFVDDDVRPTEERLGRRGLGPRRLAGRARPAAGPGPRQLDLWMPHMPKEWGGMGLGPTALAAVSAESSKTRWASYVVNCYAPDEGNMHTLLHWGTDDQKERYLAPMCEGTMRSCFAMTEPEVAGSDPTLMRTRAVPDGDEWVINGHKWFISGARGRPLRHLAGPHRGRSRGAPGGDHGLHRGRALAGLGDRARRRDHGREPQPLRDPHRRPRACPTPTGWGSGARAIVSASTGSDRPAWPIACAGSGQIETALDLMVARATQRYSHGSLLSEKQGIQWLVSESAIELYQAKLMVLHAAYRIEHKLPFTTEVSMAKHHVANTLWRVVDRAVQVHGALGYSKDSPLSGHAPAGALEPFRRRRRRDPQVARGRGGHRRLQRARHHPLRHRGSPPVERRGCAGVLRKAVTRSRPAYQV